MSRQLTLIPRADNPDTEGPCWLPVTGPGRNWRPRIKCKCGRLCIIPLHHVHADGRVTESFYDSKDAFFVHNGKKYGHMPGCGWHVYLKLDRYDQGEFPPEDAEKIDAERLG